jgi:hypothetical protein
MTEHDPNGVAAGSPGSKLDGGKVCPNAGLIGYFPRALLAVAEVSDFGARKYCRGGWVSVPDGEARYREALVRHILKEPIEGPADLDSGLLHLAHTAWNALAALELHLRK